MVEKNIISTINPISNKVLPENSMEKRDFVDPPPGNNDFFSKIDEVLAKSRQNNP